LQDIHYVEKQAAFNRERIPERVVHGKGAGAYGTFKGKSIPPKFYVYLLASDYK